MRRRTTAKTNRCRGSGDAPDIILHGRGRKGRKTTLLIEIRGQEQDPTSGPTPDYNPRRIAIRNINQLLGESRLRDVPFVVLPLGSGFPASDSYGLPWWFNTRVRDLTSLSDSVWLHPGDDQLAAGMKAQPHRIALDPQCHDALARWFYLSWYGLEEESKAKARHLLTLAGSRTPGKKQRPNKPPFDPHTLRQAYDELLEYFTELKRCIEKTKKDCRMTAVKKYFPDYTQLLGAGIDIKKMVEDWQRAKPSDLAEIYIRHWTTLSHTTQGKIRRAGL